jgi:endonuclease YncB( thermonuclease family)
MLYLAQWHRTLGDNRQDSNERTRPVAQQREESGIDAPEKGQPFGEVSLRNLARLVFDRNVRAECYKEDWYRRQVCRLFDDSRDVALAQLDAGLAWWFRGSDAMLPSSHHRNGRSTHRPRIGRGQTRWGYGAIATRCRRGSGVT